MCMGLESRKTSPILKEKKNHTKNVFFKYIFREKIKLATKNKILNHVLFMFYGKSAEEHFKPRFKLARK